jgi:hypothetical protein
MHPTDYEFLAADRHETFRREAESGHVLARARGEAPRQSVVSAIREWLSRRPVLDRLSAHRVGVDVARPGGDLGPPRRAEFGQDVLHVTAGGLGRDTK